jgi:hypothetical protein
VFAHVGNPDEGRSHSCTLVGDLGQFLIGMPEALVVFFRILWIFKTSTYFCEPETWQVSAVINSGIWVAWTDAFGIIHQEPVCRAVEGLRSRFPWGRQPLLHGVCYHSLKNLRLKTSHFYMESVPSLFKICASERATSTWSPFPVSSESAPQNEPLLQWVRSQSLQNLRLRTSHFYDESVPILFRICASERATFTRNPFPFPSKSAPQNEPLLHGVRSQSLQNLLSSELLKLTTS